MFKGVIIQGKRTHKKSRTGKGHKPYTVTFKLAHKIENGKVGPFQSVRFDIFCKHTFGGVEGKEYINAPALYFNPFETVLRSGKCRKTEENSGNNEDILYTSPAV